MTSHPDLADTDGFWLDHPDHRAWLKAEAARLFAFFAATMRREPGFHSLAIDGSPLPDTVQELHNTTRLIHAYALAHLMGVPGAARIVDHGMDYLQGHHRDRTHGGYLRALDGSAIADDRKLAYGHVFVLLAAASARIAGHARADALMQDISACLDRHFWEDGPGLFADEWTRDWQPFSTYRGMNANMHGVEALLAAFEATGREIYLVRAGRILDIFTARIAPAEGWRLPEHYTAGWRIDRDYAGDPMFRPAGTTPGHSFEFARLLLQHWDLAGRPAGNAPERARRLIERALQDAWLPEGGLAYTLDFGGGVADATRLWWPVTEAIGALAALIKLERNPADEAWYRRLWLFADRHFIDHVHGGWFAAIDATGQPTQSLFRGKPDIYHAVQACLFPLADGLSHQARSLARQG